MKIKPLTAAIEAAMIRTNLERKIYCADDLIVWADGTQCYRSELTEFSHMSDDYKVVSFGSVLYNQLVNQ